MIKRPATLGHVALTVAVDAAAAAYAMAHGVLLFALLLLPVCAASPFRRLGGPPRRIFDALKWAGWGLAAVLASLPALQMIQAAPEGDLRRVSLLAGGALSVLAGLYLYSAPGWTPGAAAIPACLALLVSAGLPLRAPGVPVLYAVAAAALVVHLAAGRRLRPAPLALLLGAAAVLALGVAVGLPLAQPWVEARLARLTSRGQAGLSLTSRLGDVESLALSAKVVLRVWADRPGYLRARTYARYAGRTWLSTPGASRFRAQAAPEEEPRFGTTPGATYTLPGGGRPALLTRILSDLRRPDVLLAPSDIRRVRLDGEAPWVDDAGVLIPAAPPPSLYAVLAGAPEVVAPKPGPEYLELPREMDPRLRELAAGWPWDVPPEEVLRRTSAFLEERCTYALDVGAFRSADPVGEFVFDKRRGYCEYFASAAALLLRLQGVPSRYVVGFSVRPSNLEGGHYVVREADAHAWVEAWLPGRGWVELDPTPAGAFEAMRAPIRGGGAWSAFWQRLAAWAGETWAYARQGRWGTAAARIGGLLAGVALLVWTVRRLRRESKPRAAAPPPLPRGARELLKALDRRWAQGGHPRPASRAPLEHLRSLSPSPGPEEPAVQALYRWIYGGAAPSAAELADLRRSLA